MLNPQEIDLLVGLEVHQQLATNRKLFCNCRPQESTEYPIRFSRKLRLAKSELGGYDPAAIFESTKSKTIYYLANPKSSCLVEYDDEPPHPLDLQAKQTALIISCALNSEIFDETYVMRKIVIDGSNTSGFQRTMLVSSGGYLQVDGKKIKVQTVCLEEDAAKLIKDTEEYKEYSLDRLGIPLVEVALEPVRGTPQEIKKIALTLGRLLRATGRVSRGLGTIRQDVNVSTGGAIVEVKGVQQLDQLEKVITYEAKRQHALKLIAQKLEKINLDSLGKQDAVDVTSFFSKSKSKVIQKSLQTGSVIYALVVRGAAGIFGYEPYPDIRLGKELGQQVRFFGIGGIFHSDELPNYGINQEELDQLRSTLQLNLQDAFIIMAAPKNKVEFAIEAVINRIKAAKKGVPAETRAATQSGETVFLRPRPGASRMYPETDIPPVIVTPQELEFAKNNIPKSWDELTAQMQKKYNLNLQLVEQILDSEFVDLFEQICENKKLNPNFVASSLCSTITSLQRQGLDASRLKEDHITKTFELLAEGKITKESVEMIFSQIMSSKISSPEEFVSQSEILTDQQLEEFVDKLVSENLSMVRSQGLRSTGPLMGMAMRSLRGKVPGEKLSKLLESRITKILER